MNNQFQAPDALAVLSPLAPLAPAPPKQPENPLLLIRRYLRGRYLIAAALGLGLSIPCALIGYVAIPPEYKSTGIIRVAPTIGAILYKTEENSPMPMFDSFVSAQTTLIKSLRVLELANEDPKLRAAGWPAGQEGLTKLTESVEANTRRGSEIILVETKHRIPSLAQTATNAVLDAYDAIQEELNGSRMGTRESLLRQRIRELENLIAVQGQEIWRLTEERGTEDLERRHSAKLDSLIRLESSIAELDLRIARARAEKTLEPSSESAPVEAQHVEVLATRDATLRSLMAERERLKIDREMMLEKYKPTHRSMLDLQRRIDSLDVRIQARAEVVAAIPTSTAPMIDGPVSMSQLEANRVELIALRASTVDDVKALGRARAAIQNTEERIAHLTRDLNDARARLDQFQLESGGVNSGRVSIVQRGDFPATPAKDRRIPLAVFGFLAGWGLGGGLVWLFGFLRDGYRYVDELDPMAAAAPLLGIIPDLSGNDPEQEEQAALSVHHIRNSLQLQTQAGRGDGGKVFTVTSGMSGDGKTHLALALGLSFARAGCRTLLIDADLVGRTLSRQLNLSHAEGLSEAIGRKTLNGEIHSTRDNLWSIPVGSAADFRPEQLSSAELSNVLEIARGSFDAIIIDSGPIMGSLEANLACSLSDRVLLVVSRGQNPRIVQAALRRIQSLGAICGGMVFNRAIPHDFSRSMSGLSTSHRVSAPAQPSRPARTDLVRIMDAQSAARPADHGD